MRRDILWMRCAMMAYWRTISRRLCGERKRRTEPVDVYDRGEDSEELHDANPACGHERHRVALKAEGMHECRAVVQQCVDATPFCT